MHLASWFHANFVAAGNLPAAGDTTRRENNLGTEIRLVKTFVTKVAMRLWFCRVRLSFECRRSTCKPFRELSSTAATGFSRLPRAVNRLEHGLHKKIEIPVSGMSVAFRPHSVASLIPVKRESIRAASLSRVKMSAILATDQRSSGRWQGAAKMSGGFQGTETFRCFA